jgi:hypothetical protein
VVAPGGGVVVLALKLPLNLTVDASNQRSSKTVRDFEQSSVKDLKLLLSEGKGD